MSLRIRMPSLGSATPPTNTIVWVKVAGVWKTSTPYIKVAGVWKTATPYIKITGIWK